MGAHKQKEVYYVSQWFYIVHGQDSMFFSNISNIDIIVACDFI